MHNAVGIAKLKREFSIDNQMPTTPTRGGCPLKSCSRMPNTSRLTI
jgi:hypothetical protein